MTYRLVNVRRRQQIDHMREGGKGRFCALKLVVVLIDRMTRPKRDHMLFGIIREDAFHAVNIKWLPVFHNRLEATPLPNLRRFVFIVTDLGVVIPAQVVEVNGCPAQRLRQQL